MHCPSEVAAGFVVKTGFLFSTRNNLVSVVIPHPRPTLLTCSTVNFPLEKSEWEKAPITFLMCRDLGPGHQRYRSVVSIVAICPSVQALALSTLRNKLTAEKQIRSLKVINYPCRRETERNRPNTQAVRGRVLKRQKSVTRFVRKRLVSLGVPGQNSLRLLSVLEA